MKNKHLQILILLFALNVSFTRGQTTIFLETMGTVGGTTTIATHESANGFDNDSYTMTQGEATSPADVRVTDASSGYSGASSSGNIWFTSTSGERGFAIEGIDASGYTNLQLSFGVRKHDVGGISLSVSYWNGSAYQNLSVSELPQQTDPTGWYYISNVLLPTDAQINGLKIRFIKTGSYGCRLDDVKLVGTSGGGGGTPTISITQSSFSFGSVSSVPTTSQTYSVSGSDLTENISITPPINFEISLNGSSWQTSSIALTQSSGTVSSTTIYARYNPSATGTHSGNISHTSTGATTQNVSVSGIYSTGGGSYYSSAYQLYGTSLRQALHEIIDGHSEKSYSSLWTHFQTTDVKTNGKVWDMYSDIPNGTPPYEFTFVSNQCGTYGGEADCYNREHSWPSSWFNDAAPAYSDLFHLYPTDGYVNNIRSNYPFGTVSSATYTSQNGSKRGDNTSTGYSGIVFEPIDDYKGDLARSMFYMSTRYYTEDGSWSTSAATNKSDLLAWYSNLLYEWHLADPVSSKEINRNEGIYGIQGNRNPFIDHPEFVAEIWKTTIAPAVVSVESENQTTVVLDFSRYVDQTAATTLSNYIFSNGIGNPQSVQWGVDNDVSKVKLIVNGLSGGSGYTIQVKNMKSINNVSMNDTTVNLNNVLPVELVSFTAVAKNSFVELQWKTATEINNYGFEVERAIMKDELGRMNWSNVGFIEGAGTTNSQKDYLFIDRNVSSGKYVYRLKQIDRDGSFEYSPEVEATVMFPQQFSVKQNYPNPFNPSTTIEYQISSEYSVQLQVVDVLGREVSTLVNERQSAGTYRVNVDASLLSSGIYFYHFFAVSPHNTSVLSDVKKMILMR